MLGSGGVEHQEIASSRSAVAHLRRWWKTRGCFEVEIKIALRRDGLANIPRGVVYCGVWWCCQVLWCSVVRLLAAVAVVATVVDAAHETQREATTKHSYCMQSKINRARHHKQPLPHLPPPTPHTPTTPPLSLPPSLPPSPLLAGGVERGVLHLVVVRSQLHEQIENFIIQLA